MDMWPDMLGHAAGLVGVNDLFAALGLNGRFFWSLGLAVGAFLIAAFPAFTRKLDRPLAVVVPVTGLLATILYVNSEASGLGFAGAALCAVLTAAGYEMCIRDSLYTSPF